jgi:hypothetical protein
MHALAEADHPTTIRHIFYQMTTHHPDLVAKTEKEYHGTICRLLVKMRMAGDLPFEWIADHTRWMRKPRTWTSLEESLRSTAQTYRRDLWQNQPVYVEMWTEKDTLAGILMEETRPWDVPLMVSKGFSSITYLYEAADSIQEIGKPTFIYYFGDHDPSGVRIDRNIEKRLREFAPDAEIHFRRVAVLRSQIEDWDLPTRPTKTQEEGNMHAKGFVGDSVEVEAIEPRTLRRMARECIERHVDQRAYEIIKAAEASEREALTWLAPIFHAEIVDRQDHTTDYHGEGDGGYGKDGDDCGDDYGDGYGVDNDFGGDGYGTGE